MEILAGLILVMLVISFVFWRGFERGKNTAEAIAWHKRDQAMRRAERVRRENMVNEKFRKEQST